MSIANMIKVAESLISSTETFYKSYNDHQKNIVKRYVQSKGVFIQNLAIEKKHIKDFHEILKKEVADLNKNKQERKIIMKNVENFLKQIH